MVRPAHWLVCLGGFAAALCLSLACGEQDYPGTAFRCDPRDADSCPGDYLCCSTDPAALDLDNPSSDPLPDYAGGLGLPIFSGVENDRGQHGRCVDPGAVGEVETLDAEAAPDVAGCPRPCNPTWTDSAITEVCGADAFCCQSDEIGEKDCVLDPDLGNAGCWRPVTGDDIQTLGGLEATDWGRDDHDTHQDPRALGCQAFIEAIEDVQDPGALLRGCYRKLGVANQRGLCTPAGGETEASAVCPLADPEYMDACELKNEDEGRAGC